VACSYNGAICRYLLKLNVSCIPYSPIIWVSCGEIWWFKKSANFGLCVSNQPVVLSAVRRCVCTASFQSILRCGVWKVRIFPVSFSVQSFHGDTMIMFVCCGLYYTIWKCAVLTTLHWNMLLPSWEFKVGALTMAMFDTSAMHCSIDTNQSLSFSSLASQGEPRAGMKDAIFSSYNFRPEDGAAFFSKAWATHSTSTRCSNHRTGLVLHCMKVLCSIWLCQL
jgi:hypothetical protein